MSQKNDVEVLARCKLCPLFFVVNSALAAEPGDPVLEVEHRFVG